MATFRQGRRICQSGRNRCPFGDTSGCRHRTTVMAAPPKVKAMALATAAPMTPIPAPGTVKPPISRVG